jgi:hypothetical protein
MKPMNSQKPSVAPWFALALTLLISGCRTVDPVEVANFATTTTAVKAQANDALNSAASLTRSESVAFAASKPTLAEINFVQTPTAETIAGWDNALSTMEIYANNLSALLSPNAVRDFDAAATNLFNQFSETATALKANSISSQAGVNALLATAFTEVADAIIQAKQQATAIKVAKTTDVHVASICDLFAKEIGADRTGRDPSLRRTLYHIWADQLDRLSKSFVQQNADKMALSQQYADCLARRDAQDQILDSLRRSLLSLKDAHHLLALGKPASIQAILNSVAAEIQHSRDLYNQFSSLAKK